MKRCFLLCPLFASILLASHLPAAEKPLKPIVAVYDLEGAVSESGQPDDSIFGIAMDATRPLTMLDVTRSLEKAAADPVVKAVVVAADDAELDFSQIQEIRGQLLALREAGKDVWMYSEHLTNATALLGSAANHFALMPEAACEFHGIHAESMYFKGLLDKLGVRAEVIHIGDFKSFGETFYRTGPSDEAKRQQEQLIDSIYDQLIAGVAAGRKLAPDKVRAIIDDGGINAAKIVEAGVADHLLYRTGFVKKLRESYGKDADFDRCYELPDTEGPEIKGIFDLFKLLFKDTDGSHARKDYVAVVALDGDITGESVEPVRSQILKLAKEEKAKALVLRVNSPGGSAMASEVLWEAANEWKTSGKPFVVSMGGVAASGGYYVSSGANRIFAEAGTITGSIGVVGMKFVVSEALDKLGISTHTVQRGKSAGLMSMTRGYSDEEAKVVRDSMLEVYATFKKRVTEGRGKALKGDLEPLAGGRVYSGKQALEIGLVDEIGGLHQAVAHATREAKLNNPEVRLLPEPKSGLEGLFAKPERKSDDDIIRGPAAPGTASRLRAAMIRAGVTDALPASAKSAVLRLAARVEAFRKSPVLLLGPDFDLR
jgi:protease-4